MNILHLLSEIEMDATRLFDRAVELRHAADGPDNKMIMAIITIQLNFSMMKTTLFLFLILSSPLFMVKQTQ